MTDLHELSEELREKNEEIRSKMERIGELRAALTSMNIPIGEKVQTSPTDRLSNLMCQVITLEGELNDMVDDYANLKSVITKEILSLDNEGWQDCLYAHYVEFKPWKEIAENQKTSKRAVMRKKDRAVKKLKSIRKDTKSC